MSGSRMMKTALAIMLLTLALGGAVWGAEATQATGAMESVTFRQIWREGGICMYPLAVMSFLAIALIIYFFFVLRQEQVVPEKLRRDVVEKLKQGLWDDVRTACGYRPCPFSEMTVLALDHVAAAGRADPAQIKDLLEGEGTRQSAALQSQIQYLLDVAVISPMIGLLGTVLGMYTAFSAVSQDLAKSNPQLLAYGVKEAIVTTVAGLMIGIPVMMFYAYFRGRVSRLVSELELAAGEVMRAILQARG